MIRNRVRLLVGIVLPLVGVHHADAILIDYEISGTLSDGGTFQGGFRIDTDAPDTELSASAGTFDSLPGFVEITGGSQDGVILDSFVVRQVEFTDHLTQLFFSASGSGPLLAVRLGNGLFADPNVLEPISGVFIGGNIGESADVTTVAVLSVPDTSSTVVMLGIALIAVAAASSAGNSRARSKEDPALLGPRFEP